MNKKVFEDDIISGMQDELRKQASSERQPKLVRAAECLHATLEILEAQGLQARADEVLQLLQKIAQTRVNTRDVEWKMPSVNKLMEKGITQRDMQEFAKGSPVAKAKFNLVLRELGMSEHQIAKFLGHKNVMSEQEAKEMLDPNRNFGKMWQWMQDPTVPTDPSSIKPGETVEFESVAPQGAGTPTGESLEFKSLAARRRKPSKPGKVADPHTKGLTPEKEVENYKKHGIPFNMADDACAIDVPPPVRSAADVDPDFAELLSFDGQADDDELMSMDIKEDSLEVFENEPEDFEDERS